MIVVVLDKLDNLKASIEYDEAFREETISFIRLFQKDIQ
jgi:hypothetical protein